MVLLFGTTPVDGHKRLQEQVGRTWPADLDFPVVDDRVELFGEPAAEMLDLCIAQFVDEMFGVLAPCVHPVFFYDGIC